MKTFRVIAVMAAASLLWGCAAFRMSVKEVDPTTTKPLTAKYDHRDMQTWTDEMADAILTNPFPPEAEGQEAPIMVGLGIQNRTKRHVDMKSILDTLETKLMNSGKMRFVNAGRRDDLLKEQGYQLANATQDTRVSIGKQLGAQFMITGSLVEIGHQSGRQVRVSKQEDVYYQLTVEITDVKTGLILLRKQVERVRSASKPLIGW